MSQPLRPYWFVLLAAGSIVGMAMGLRQVMGLYLPDMTRDLGIGREPFSTAMAVANLIWGVGSVGLGLVSDRYGAGRVIAIGAVSTVAGLLLMSIGQPNTVLLTSGFLLGLGVAGTGLSGIVGALSRAVPESKRMAAIASMGMASGIGTLIAFPYTHLAIQMLGWRHSLWLLAATAVAMLPLGILLAGKPVVVTQVKNQNWREALDEAFRLPSFWLLTAGFFVCGFHLSFYGVHLPAFVADKGMPAWVGVWALMAVAITNILGTYLSGQSGRFMEKRQVLSFIYLMRCLPFFALLVLPLTPVTVIALSAVLGLFWLSTVPPTSGLVATFFGTQWMSMLYGIVFLSHQLGSFAGLYIAGQLYDQTKSYDLMWWICIALGLFAAVIHWPIRERPTERMAAELAAAAK